MRWVGLVALHGCIEFGVSPVAPHDPPVPLVSVTERFQQAPEAAVDLLFVVDNTASMGQEHQALAAHFDGLAIALDAAELGWHIGVVTTDMTGAQAGWLRGSPYVLTPGTPDLQEQLAERIDVGVDGAVPAAGLAAAMEAIALAGADGPNRGFRRPGAVLHIIFISDTDDGSDGWLGPDPQGVFLDWLQAQAEESGVSALASGVVGDLPQGCVSVLGSAQPGFRYHAVIDEVEGEAASICEVDFGPLMERIADVSVTWPRVFVLREAPLPNTVQVRVDGARWTEGWALQPEAPAIAFEVPPPPSSRITVSYVVENAR